MWTCVQSNLEYEYATYIQTYLCAYIAHTYILLKWFFRTIVYIDDLKHLLRHFKYTAVDNTLYQSTFLTIYKNLTIRFKKYFVTRVQAIWMQQAYSVISIVAAKWQLFAFL